MNKFSVLISVCGLSRDEAADFLNVRRDTIRKFSNGRNEPSPGLVEELYALLDQIEKTAHNYDEAIEKTLKNQPEKKILIEAPADNAAAQLLGFPTVGAWLQMIGRIFKKYANEIDFKIMGNRDTLQQQNEDGSG